MKLYINLARAVTQALQMIFEDGRYADKVIEKVLKQNPKWGARDRKFIAETTYDIVRWYRLIQNITEAEEGDYWKLLGGWCIVNDIPLPAWEEFAGLNAARVTQRLDKMNNIRRFRESIPDWMDEQGERELNDRWETELHALNGDAAVVLRTNSLKTTRKELRDRLEADGIVTSDVAGAEDALQLRQRQNVFRHESFKEGLFEVQDTASQFVAPFLQPAPGLRVIDACAGAGGKTLHLAALMRNRGRLVALDVEPAKLEELKKRARRAGVDNLEVRHIESSKTIKRLENTADRLLLDVPCSGLGVLRRNPDAKWKLSPSFIDEVRGLQQHILNDYETMLKPGGLMVYSTCSIMPSENENQVKTFLEQQKGKFELISERHCWPSEGFDGFYMALMRKTDRK